MATLKTITNDYVFGRGQLYFNRLISGVYQGMQPLGNCPAFALSVASEQFEHKSSTAGLSTTDLTLTRSVTFSGTVTCDDCQPNNFAMAFGGTLTEASTAGTAVTNEALVVRKDGTFQLGVSTTNPLGVRAISSVTVTDTAGTTTYTLNTDYKLDTDLGLIYIISGGAITNGQTIHVDYTPTAATRTLIESGSGGSVEGELWFYADNANGTNRDVKLASCTLSVNGDIPFITADDIISFELQIGVSKLNSSTAAIAIQDRS